jgi:hypothetical protein
MSSTQAMTDSYNLAFDLGREANLFGLWTLLVVPAAAALALVLRVVFGSRKLSKSDRYLWIIVVAWGLVDAVLIPINFVKAERLRDAEAAGNAVTVEGCLRHFHAEARGGHEGEQLDLNGALTIYSSDDETPGFHQTEAHGGPIHKDSKIRVTSVFGEIVRLETRDHACPPAPDIASNPAE